MSDLANEAECHLSAFRYARLDHTKASIRLLRISPELSSLGCVQCHMWHADVDAQYTCLSYVWGSYDNPQTILLNGKSFRVQKNLFDFLEVARTQYADPQRVFWIDAVSIDQTSILERNHQVAQMGSIYTNASEVIGWLGYSESIERALRRCVDVSLHGPLSQIIWAPRDDSFKEDWRELQEHCYWGRAWITQEILLARRFKLLVNHFETEPAQFSRIARVLSEINDVSTSDSSNTGQEIQLKLFNSYLQALCEKKKLSKRPLSVLLHQFPGRESHIPRDRIYSLLSIASDADSFPIDYGSKEGSVLSAAISQLEGSMCLCLWLHIVNAIECGSMSGVLECDAPGPVIHLQMSPCVPKRTSKIHMAIGNENQCRYCNQRLDSLTELVYCTRQICKAVDATHFSVMSPEGFLRRVTMVKNWDLKVRNFGPTNDSHSWMPSRRQDHIEILAPIFIQLIRSCILHRKDGRVEDIYQVPLHLCHNAQVGRSSPVFRAASEQMQRRFEFDEPDDCGFLIAPVSTLSKNDSSSRITSLGTLLGRKDTDDSGVDSEQSA